MHQVVALSCTVILHLLSSSYTLQRFYRNGNWAEALGNILVSIVMFYAINVGVYLVIFVIMKITRHHGWLAPFRSTKIHYVGLSVAILLFIGAMAMRGATLTGQAG